MLKKRLAITCGALLSLPAVKLRPAEPLSERVPWVTERLTCTGAVPASESAITIVLFGELPKMPKIRGLSSFVV